MRSSPDPWAAILSPLAFAALLGAAEGDRVTLAVELLTRYPLDHVQAALAVLLALKELDGAEPPPSLRRRLRTLLRETQHPVAGYLAACAAQSVDDHWVKVLATRWTRTLEGIPAEEVDPLLRLFREPSLDALPEVETIPRTHQVRCAASGSPLVETIPAPAVVARSTRSAALAKCRKPRQAPANQPLTRAD